MKVQCEVCEKAEAEVLCCADEAVLCSGCDEKVHAANKLSQKHPRVSLLKYPNPASSSSSFSPSSSQLPPCDICEKRNGYFFCLEDRAILCRHCDMSTHMVSPFVSSHQRFLIGDIKVALDSSSTNNSSESYRRSTCSNSPTGHENGAAHAMVQDIGANFAETAATSGESDHLAVAGSWALDDVLGTYDFNYEFSEMESSRTIDP